MKRSAIKNGLSWLAVAAVVNMGASAFAAPPTLTHLYPSGVQRGTSVEVAAGGTFDHWPPQVWVEGKGLEVRPAAKGLLRITAAADATPGTYWIRLHDEDGATALRPFIVGMLPEVMEKEPNNDVKNAQVIATPNVTINGRLLKPGEVDCFAVKLTKGQTLVASLEAHSCLGSPMDAMLQIVSADSFVLDHNDDYHGMDPQIVFSVPRDGTYVVRTYAFPAVQGADIRFAGNEQFVYRLTLATTGFADYAFPLAVSRAEPGQAEVIGWNIPDAARKLTAVPVDGLEFATLFHPQLANPVRVRIEPHPVIRQAKPNDRQNAQTIALPVTIGGCVERSGEVHVYQFEAKKGQRLLFQAEAQAIGFPLNPTLRLLDGTGKQVTQAESPGPQRDPELAYSVPLDGRYQLELRDLHASGSSRHLYRLRAALAEPDFVLTLAADRFALQPGKTLDIPVTIDRRNGFNGEIDLIAEGLPEGVTATVVPPAAAAKTITLRLTAGMTSASAPFLIRGTVKGKDELTRMARAATVGVGTTTHQVWLSLSATAKVAANPPKK